jgi:cobalamin biosynthesis Mg chelatase CobN
VAQAQFDPNAPAGSQPQSQQQQHYFNHGSCLKNEDSASNLANCSEHFQQPPAFDQNYLHYLDHQKHEDSQQSQEDDDDEDDEDDEEEDDDEEDFTGPSNLKRKRAFSFSSAPSASTTNAVTTSSRTSIAGPSAIATGNAVEKRPATKICRVCGDKAYSYNFNVNLSYKRHLLINSI